MKLTRERIVAAALNLLGDAGLEGITLRRLAAQLGVQAPTLYWHIRDKDELLTLLGDAVVAPLAQLPEAGAQNWQEWLVSVAIQFRRALLAHRDGARIVASAQMSPA